MKTRHANYAKMISIVLATVMLLAAAFSPMPALAAVSRQGSLRNGLSHDTRSAEAAVPEEFVGDWEYEKYHTFVRIEADGRWTALDKEGNVVASGHTELDGSSLVLKNFGGATVITVTATSDGKLKDSDGDLLSRSNQLPEQKGEPLESYFGIWELKDGGIWLDFHPNKKLTYYVLEDGELYYVYDAGYAYTDGQVHANGSNGDTGTGYKLEPVVFTLDGTTDILYTDSGDAYLRSELPDHNFPVPSDEMSETLRLSACEKFTFHYPETLSLKEEQPTNALLSPADSSVSNADYICFFPFVMKLGEAADTNYNRGQSFASAQIQMDLDHLMSIFFGDEILSSTTANFTNGSIYYEAAGIAYISGEVYEPAYDGDVAGGVFARYCGPYGYMPGIAVIAPTSSFYCCIQTAYQMLDSMTTRYGWRTSAGKKTPSLADISSAMISSGRGAASVPAPAAGTSSGKTSSGSASTGSITGYSLPRPFYWTDTDGDIWYWNGMQNIFYAFGDDFYIEDGHLMESNDSGWSEEFGDLDFDSWSDPGDYYSDYEEYDYYESSDYYDYYDYEEYFDTYDEEYFEAYDYYYDDFNDDYYDDYDYDDYNYDYEYEYDYDYDYDYGSDW